jgi:CHAT domain
LFIEIVENVVSLSNQDEKHNRIHDTFFAVCSRNGIVISDRKIAFPDQATMVDQTKIVSTNSIQKRKVLFLASSPVTESRLRLDKEYRDVREGLQRSSGRNLFELISYPAAQVADIRRGLLDHSPQIVHFSGHGDKDGILVESENGRAMKVDAIALAELFKLCSDHVECVLLNACYSHEQATAIAKSISYVIGMNTSVVDSIAINFAVAFYDALGAGKSIESAFGFAKNAISFSDKSGKNLPVLVTKST